MDRIGLPPATAASAVGGSGHDAAAAGFAPGGRVGTQASHAVQGNHHRMPEILSGPGRRPTGRRLATKAPCSVLEGIAGDMRPAAPKWPAPFTPGSVAGRVSDAGCMDLHPRDRA